jgi:hypothetical protein
VQMTWGILWRPLKMRFDRRAHLVTALLHLHNVRVMCNQRAVSNRFVSRECKDIGANYGRTEWNVGHESDADDDDDERGAACWVFAPFVDRDGRPVELMSNAGEYLGDGAVQRSRQSKTEARLCKAIHQLGITRPRPVK